MLCYTRHSVLITQYFLMAESNQPISLISDHLFADLATELLRQGKSVRFRAPGRSMYPTIKEQEIITVEPIEPSKVKKGDIILYRSDAGVVAHRVLHIIETEPSMAQSSSLSPQSLSLPIQSSVLSPHYSFILRDDTWGATSSQIEGSPGFGEGRFGREKRL